MQNNIKSKVIYSNSFNPWFNLTLEEYFLNNVGIDEIILYLWQNDNTVVIGRNQNPWKECKIEKIKEDQGKLARRLSGGGAVYHDMGNLNFTFIAGKEIYSLENQFNIILSALKKFGIRAELSGRNDITYKDKKFSGNAYFTNERACFHHGTILINTNFSKLSEFLTVSKEKIQSKGIDSVKARVVNLQYINSNITIENMKDALKNAFVDVYKTNLFYEIHEENAKAEVIDIYNKFSSWEFIYGDTPEFDYIYEKRFSWGGVEIGFNITNGIVENVKTYTDALDVKVVDRIYKALVYEKFDMSKIHQYISDAYANNK